MMINTDNPARPELPGFESQDVTPSFDEFWALWPRRVAKKEAQRVWSRLCASQKRAALQAVPAHAELWRRERRAAVHIPHASRWLNGERWEDEVIITRTSDTWTVAVATARSSSRYGGPSQDQLREDNEAARRMAFGRGMVVDG